MPTPSTRNPIRPARGLYSDLAANVLDLHEGELCYAVDRDVLYVVESGVLQPVNQTATPGSDLMQTNINNAQIGDSLNYDGSFWVNGGVQDGGNF